MAKSAEDSDIETEIVGVDKNILANPELNFESGLREVPKVISSMGQLLLISAEKDFSLIGHLPENTKFKYLKHADSFRACLVQVSNGVWRAFDNAHISMERIYLITSSIDEDMNLAFEIRKEEESSIACSCLERIDTQSNKCVKEAESITNEFQVVVDTMNELFEACSGSQKIYYDEKAETIAAQKTAAEKKKDKEEDLDYLKKERAEEKDEVKKAKEEIKIAVNSYPADWKIYLCRSADDFIHAVSSISSTLLHRSIRRTTPEREGPPLSTRPMISNDEIIAYLAAMDILQDAKRLCEQHCANKEQNVIEMLKERFQKNVEELGKSESNSIVVIKAIKLCKDGVERCQDKLDSLKQSEDSDELTKRRFSEETKSRCEKFHDDAVSFEEKAKEALNVLVEDRESQLDGPLTRSLLRSAEQKRYHALTLLHLSYGRYDLCDAKIHERARELHNLEDELLNINYRTLDLENITDTLHRGMKILADVLNHWKHFRATFETVHNLAKEWMRPSVERFRDITDANIRNLPAKMPPKKITLDIKEEACKTVSVVQSISCHYVEISKKFLRNEASSLHMLVSLNPEHDRKEMENMSDKIQQNSLRARDGIKKIADERRKKMMENFTIQQDNATVGLWEKFLLLIRIHSSV